ncbi:MAG: hypothetical protein IPN94_12600 [Sphingobacteriales bacterium]|nr:hypothetical protein [Sphingobacteriales bacterium]
MYSKTFFTVLLLILSNASLFAQALNSTQPIMFPVDGYVITNSGDTLYGKVSVTLVTNYVAQIVFKDTQTNKKVKYKPADIKAFCQKRNILFKDFEDLTTIDQDYVHYESHNHPKKNKLVFMERLLNGSHIRMYDNPAAVTSNTSVGGITIDRDAYSYVVIKDQDAPIIINSPNFKETFPKLVDSCPAFVDFLTANDAKNKFRHLAFLVENYNRVCE